MHPILGNRFRLTLYLSAWVFVGVWLAVLLRVTGAWPLPHALLFAVPMALLYGFMCLSAWWVCRAAPLARSVPGRTLVALVGAALVASVVWAILGTAWAEVVFAIAGKVDRWVQATSVGGDAAATLQNAETLRTRGVVLCLALGIPSYLFSAVVHYLIVAFEDSRAAERRALQSQVMARDAELRALRAQLNPHFLFNSLNSINGLVGKDPEAARRMCERLGDFLRQTLALAACDTVSFGDEMRLVERYLAIEKVRFGDRLEERIRVTPEAETCQVPPLLLQPLVENAVKHGITSRVEGGTIEIDAARDGDDLRVTVVNPCDEEVQATSGEGVGLENVRRRLRALDPRHSQLTAMRRGAKFEVVLRLAARTSPNPREVVS
jgi:two-component sensor histidine kinase